ncbi:MAG: isochorismatase [Chloroflexi bacterium]|nr:MAG: isochorismatase [Chloroflexota bacterium]
MDEGIETRGVDFAGQMLFRFRRSYLLEDAGGHRVWREEVVRRTIPSAQTAIIVCDMWDRHWSRGAAERVDAMAPRMNDVLQAARGKGVCIIHAPSDTMSYYAETPARRRMRAAPYISPPAEVERSEPPLPIDDSDGGSDTGESEAQRVWTRQHDAIEIDHNVDGISDNGQEIYNFLQQAGIRQLLIMGVHTNMCILNRSFGIKQMVKWGINIALVRDLTDAMYNPARLPYVDHDAGTQLVVGYVEKFWCSTIHSDDLMGR